MATKEYRETTLLPGSLAVVAPLIHYATKEHRETALLTGDELYKEINFSSLQNITSVYLLYY